MFRQEYKPPTSTVSNVDRIWRSRSVAGGGRLTFTPRLASAAAPELLAVTQENDGDFGSSVALRR